MSIAILLIALEFTCCGQAIVVAKLFVLHVTLLNKFGGKKRSKLQHR